MRERELKEKLKNQADSIVVPNVLNEIKNRDFLGYRNDLIVPQPQGSPTAKRFAWAGAVAASLAIIFLFAFVIFPQVTFDKNVSATVGMSINGTASFSFELNSKSQIIEITADSPDGNALLESLSYKRKKFDLLLTELLMACVDNWNFTESQLNSKVTFTVSCHNSEQRTTIENHCNNSMNTAKQHCRNHHGK